MESIVVGFGVTRHQFAYMLTPTNRLRLSILKAGAGHRSQEPLEPYRRVGVADFQFHGKQAATGSAKNLNAATQTGMTAFFFVGRLGSKDDCKCLLRAARWHLSLVNSGSISKI